MPVNQMKMLWHQSAGWFVFVKKLVQSLVFPQAGALVPRGLAARPSQRAHALD